MLYRNTLLALAIGLATSARAEMVPVWTTGGGTMKLTPAAGVLQRTGIELRGPTNDSFVGTFTLTKDSRIKFVTPWGSPDSFLGGSLLSTNSITILVTAPDGYTNIVTIPHLELHALKDTGTFELRDDDDEPVLVFEHFDTRFEPSQHQLLMQRGEARISDLFAEKTERPELAGLCIGVIECAVEIHELEARIERRKVPPPYACGLPAAPNAALRLKDIETVQHLGGTTDTVHISTGLLLENPGPFVASITALNTVRHTLALHAVKNGTTTEVARIEQTTPFHPANRNPCPDETKFIPGALARHTLADAILDNTGLTIPASHLTTAASGETRLLLTASTDTGTLTRRLTPTLTRDHWHFRLAPP